MIALDRFEGRQTGVNTSDIMPDGWKVAPLKRFFRVVGGATPTSDSENWDGDIPWVTPGDLSGLDTFFIGKGKRNISERGHQSCSTELVPKGSVIISTRAPIGSLAIAQERLCTNQGCKALVPTTTVDSRFFAYALSVATPQLNALGQGSTFRELSGESLGSFRLPVPSHQEQRRIAAFLDHETARIDELVREQERLIELLVEDLDAQVFSLLTAGARQGVQRKASGNPWFPEIPSHWTSSRLGWVVASIQTGPFGSQLHAEDYVTSGTPLINPASIGPRGLIEENASRVDEETLDRLKEYRLKSGDIVLGRRGQMGRCALVTAAQEGWLLGTGSMRIRPNRNVNAEFLTIYLGSSIARSYLELESVGTTMSNLNSEIVGGLPLPLPPKSEQDAIATRIQEATRLVDESIDAATSMVELLVERRSALISAAVTGQLDLSDWQQPEPEAVAEVA